TLGAAGLAAMLSAPFAAEAKKGGKNKKKRNHVVSPPVSPPPAPDLCAPQADDCTAILTNICGPNPTERTCQLGLQCCSFLGTCDAGEFVFCLSNAFRAASVSGTRHLGA